jgi:hypothetical protein
MPWPVSTSHTASCVYEQCEQSGHAVCKGFADYYERLCGAAQAVVTAPNGDNLSRLQDILHENKGLQYD